MSLDRFHAAMFTATLSLDLVGPIAQAAPSDDYKPRLIDAAHHRSTGSMNHDHVVIEPLHPAIKPKPVVFLSG